VRHSRNLGPGMVLLFQPRSVFVDTITNKVIGREARNQVRKRLETWDEIPAHPDLGFFGDPGNLEWKQYFLDDGNTPADDRCPFLKRQRQAKVEAAAEPPPATSPATSPVTPPARPTWWQQRPGTASDRTYTPRPVLHPVEHRLAPHRERDFHEHDED
jgi:uncharacterized protein